MQENYFFKKSFPAPTYMSIISYFTKIVLEGLEPI
jgi:hypothetical protein